MKMQQIHSRRKIQRSINLSISTLWSASGSQDATPLCTDSEKQDVCLCPMPWGAGPGVRFTWRGEHILKRTEKREICVKKGLVNLGWWLKQSNGNYTYITPNNSVFWSALVAQVLNSCSLELLINNTFTGEEQFSRSSTEVVSANPHKVSAFQFYQNQ